MPTIDPALVSNARLVRAAARTCVLKLDQLAGRLTRSQSRRGVDGDRPVDEDLAQAASAVELGERASADRLRAAECARLVGLDVVAEHREARD